MDVITVVLCAVTQTASHLLLDLLWHLLSTCTLATRHRRGVSGWWVSGLARGGCVKHAE